MKNLFATFFCWWAFLHVIWMALTFILWGIVDVDDNSPITLTSEFIYDYYAFDLFQMNGWVILGFAPAVWATLRVTTGRWCILPWRKKWQVDSL